MKSKIVAGKGLELACFVAERLGSWPDETGAFAFAWAPEDGSGEEWGANDFAGGAKARKNWRFRVHVMCTQA